jgi:hypothetical protein
MRRHLVLTWSILIGGLITAAPAAMSQPVDVEYLPGQEEIEGAEEPPPEGWEYNLSIGSGFSFGSSRSVIGNTDGNTWTVGVNVDGAANLRASGHEWRNTLTSAQAFTRTPLIDEFVKSGDQLMLRSIWLYHIPSAPWVGPFFRFRLTTAIFAGRDVQAEQSTYQVTEIDGTVRTVDSDRLDLTDPFQPLTMGQTAGVFLRPLSDPALQAEFLLGFGLRETFAKDQLALLDDEDTAQLEVVELDSFVQGGTEGVATFWGEQQEGRVTYEAGIEVLIPFINDLEEGDDRNALDLTNIDIGARLSFKLFEWASLDYSLRALLEPQLLDEWQIQNQLLLSIGFVLLEAAPEAEAEAEAPAEAE